LCISSARTDKFGQQQITYGDANKEIEMMKFQNNNSDRRHFSDLSLLIRFSETEKGWQRYWDPGTNCKSL